MLRRDRQADKQEQCTCFPDARVHVRSFALLQSPDGRVGLAVGDAARDRAEVVQGASRTLTPRPAELRHACSRLREKGTLITAPADIAPTDHSACGVDPGADAAAPAQGP
jgi:hypothetical protein